MWIWLFALLPVAFLWGWLSRGARVQKPAKKDMLSRVASLWHQDYFRGLNYLINDEPDKAVDVFIRLMEVDSETVETHLALGNLFRRRGEVDRAIRIHQNLIARPQLGKEHRIQALSELAQDYLSAGMLDRAERLFLELVDTGANLHKNLRFLLSIYTQEKEWERAIHMAQRLGVGHFSKEIAHFCCELAEQCVRRQNVEMAQQHVKKALAVDKHCVRAHLLRAQWAAEQGNVSDAMTYYRIVGDDAPEYLSEVVRPLMLLHQTQHTESACLTLFERWLSNHPDVALVLAMADLLTAQQGLTAAIEFLATTIQLHPSLRGLQALLTEYASASSSTLQPAFHTLSRVIEQLLDKQPLYQCVDCGYAGRTLFWSCPSCHHWSTVRPMQV